MDIYILYLSLQYRYHVEAKNRNSIKWMKINRHKIQGTSFKCGNLSPGLVYEFRVFAENLAGKFLSHLFNKN